MPFHELSDLTHDKFISSLPDPLSSLVQQASEISFVSNRSDHFEILTRSHVLEITEKILDAFKSNDEAIIEEGMVELISFIRSVIDFSLYIAKRSNLKDAKNDEWSDMDSAQMRKVPFLLLEDSFDSLPLSLTRILWTYGPAEWLPNICDETLLFNQGSKYVLIRVANKLLKSLSVNAENQAASFAGEISMTLAAVFPLSERSAVNVLGSFHTDNIVKFESMEEWIEKKGSEKEQQELVMNYDFYSKLWGVQQTFTNPKELLPLGSTNWNENLDNFLEEVKFIFSLFEGRKFKSDLIKHLNARWKKAKHGTISRQKIQSDGDAEMKDATDNQESIESLAPSRQYKYLTNSQLIHLQLQDPEIRVHFLTQLLIISKYLTSSLAAFSMTPAGSNVSTKMICEKNQVTLHQLEVRAAELMKAIPPNGEEHFKTLEWILKDRESIWRRWKKNKCEPSIEQFSSNNGDVDKIIEPRRNYYGLKSSNDESIAIKSENYSFKIDFVKDLPVIAKDLSSKGNKTDQFLVEYADALDPDAGIEEEYHPRKNKLASWRALRSLSRDYIGHFGDVNNNCMISKRTGDFEGIIRKIWKEEKNINIPGDMPDVEEDSDSEVGDDEVDEDAAGNSNSEAPVEDLFDSKEVMNEDSEKTIIDEAQDTDETKLGEKEGVVNEIDLKTEEINSNDHDVVIDSQQESEGEGTGTKGLDEKSPGALDDSTAANEDDTRKDKTHGKDNKQPPGLAENKEADLDSRSRRKRSRSNSVDRRTKKQKGETTKNDSTEDTKVDKEKDDPVSASRSAPNKDNRSHDNSRAFNRSSQHLPPRGGNLRGAQYPPTGMRRSPPPNLGIGQPVRGHAGPGNFRGSYGGPRGRDDRGPRGGGRGGDMERDRRGGAGQRNSRR